VRVPINFECPCCGKKLKAPITAVGKSSKCPGCGNVVTCPDPVYDVDVVDPNAEAYPGPRPPDDLGGDTPYALLEPPVPAAKPAEGRCPCPMCGEMILASAAKCRYCGEVFDPGIKKAKGHKPRKYSVDDEELSGGEILLAILCSGIGCIMGIIWMAQGKPKGLKMFGLSILVGVIWNVVRAFLSGVGKPGGFGGP
jgi:hypothetical protein